MNIIIRTAQRLDVPDIVRLLAEDNIGVTREKYAEPIPETYYAAFDNIHADKNNMLIVAECDNKVVGTLQLTFITYLTYQGGKRAQIEGVRVDRAVRGKGIGKIMLDWAIKKSQAEGCHLLQLTTDKKRPEALEFYKTFGFLVSHEGLKLHF